MITECRTCGDPLLPNQDRCAGCGAENPSYAKTGPPTASMFRSDASADWGLLLLGLLGLLLALIVFLESDPGVPAMPPWVAGVNALLGGIFLIIHHRISFFDIRPTTKTILRGCMACAFGFFLWVFWAFRLWPSWLR